MEPRDGLERPERGSDRRHRVATDALLVLGVTGVQILLLEVTTGGLPHRSSVATYLLITAQGLPLFLRHRWPLVTFALVLVPNTVYYAMGFPPSGLDLGLAVALYTVAARHPRAISLGACGAVVLVCTTLWLLDVGPYWSNATVALLVYLLVFFSAAWAWGRYHRALQQMREAHVAELVARAERLERDRSADRDRAVAEERRRIARELHDSLAHQLSVMVVHAGAARRLLGPSGGTALEAIEAVEEAGRRSLELMPNLVHALRGQDEDGLRPQPTLADLDALVDRVRRAGLRIRVERIGAGRDVPRAVDLSAYRVLQEALTNCLKHAAGSAVTVRLEHTAHGLTVSVRDDGGTPMHDGPPASGHGLVGMRERVALFGGRLQSGRTPEGGYAVSATFPQPEGSR